MSFLFNHVTEEKHFVNIVPLNTRYGKLKFFWKVSTFIINAERKSNMFWRSNNATIKFED